jgi:hypothetical protein
LTRTKIDLMRIKILVIRKRFKSLI